MPVTGFSHYNLRASQPLLDALLDFYRDVVGLRSGYRPPFKSFGYWLYVGDHDVLHLTEADPSEERPPNTVNTFDHVALSCTGLAAFEAHLDKLGIKYSNDHVPLTSQCQVFLNDPAGNGVELNFADSDACVTALPSQKPPGQPR